MPFERKTDPDTILLTGEDNSRDRIDGVAQAALTPGELVKVTGVSDTGVDDSRDLVVQDGEAVPVPFRVAIEYSHTGRGIDDDYSVDEHAEYRHIKAGERAYCFLADTETVDYDDLLVSDGNGHFRAAAGDGSEDAAAIAVAAEDVDNETGGAPARIRVEAL